MRVLPVSLMVVCLMGTASPVRAASGPTPTMAGTVGRPWILATRQRVTRALLTMRHIRRGILQIHFNVAADGRLSAVRAEGPSIDVPKVVAAARSIGQVMPPPDRQSHAVAVQLRIN